MNRRIAKKLGRRLTASLTVPPWQPRREEALTRVLARLIRRYDWAGDERPWTDRCEWVCRLDHRARRGFARRGQHRTRGYGSSGWGLRLCGMLR